MKLGGKEIFLVDRKGHGCSKCAYFEYDGACPIQLSATSTKGGQLICESYPTKKMFSFAENLDIKNWQPEGDSLEEIGKEAQKIVQSFDSGDSVFITILGKNPVKKEGLTLDEAIDFLLERSNNR